MKKFAYSLFAACLSLGLGLSAAAGTANAAQPSDSEYQISDRLHDESGVVVSARRRKCRQFSASAPRRKRDRVGAPASRAPTI